MRRFLVGLSIAGAVIVPATAAMADNATGQAASAPTTVVTKTVDVTTKSVVPATSVVTNTGQATVTTVEQLEPKDNNDDGDSKAGLWGLLGLLGLAGLAGLAKKRRDDDNGAARRGTVGPQAGATGTGTTRP